MTILCLLAFLGGNLHGLLCCCHSVHPSQVVWYVPLSLCGFYLFMFVGLRGTAQSISTPCSFLDLEIIYSLTIDTKIYRCTIGYLEVLCIHFDKEWMNYVCLPWVTGLQCNISLVMFRGKAGGWKKKQVLFFCGCLSVFLEAYANSSFTLFNFKIDVIRKIE